MKASTLFTCLLGLFAGSLVVSTAQDAAVQDAAVQDAALPDAAQPGPGRAQPGPGRDGQPNFVVIFCDNLGYGDIEPFGSTVHRTPHLSRMAKQGRKFTHFCVTAGVCTPSRSSLMTGCYSQRVGMHDNPRDGQVLRPVSPYGLHPDEVTIAEVLKDAHYATGMIGKWHLGDQPEFLPTRQGFDWFFGIPYSDDMTAEVGARVADRFGGQAWPPLPLMENERVIEAPVDRNGLTKRYTERALEFIRTHRDEPFFLYLPHAMPGSTREPFSSPEFRGKSDNGPWGDAIEELDWSTGQILDELVRLKIDDQTLVVWTSDNGAPLARDPEDPSRGSNQPLHGRGYTTGEGAFRVPTIMWWPGKIAPGSHCDQLATTMDLLPTLAHLAGGKVPQDRVIDGHDISPLICQVSDENSSNSDSSNSDSSNSDSSNSDSSNRAEPARTPYDAFFYYERDQLQAVRRGQWKLFLPLKTFRRHPHFQANQQAHALLFDLVSDPSCTENVAAEHPEIVRQLTRDAQRARQDLGDLGQRGRGQREIGNVESPKALTM